MCFFAKVRGAADSVITVILLLFILDIEYEDVVLVHSHHVKPIKENFVHGNSTPFTSASKREYARFYMHSSKFTL